jgi:hypothetical protein
MRLPIAIKSSLLRGFGKAVAPPLSLCGNLVENLQEFVVFL